MKRRSTGSRAWNNRQDSHCKRLRKRKEEENGNDRRSGCTRWNHSYRTTKSQLHGCILTIRRSGKPISRPFWRGSHRFCKTAPGICWERLPSSVMGYLIRAADMPADRPEVIAITMATWLCDGCDEAKDLVLVLLPSHQSLTAVTQELRDDNTC